MPANVLQYRKKRSVAALWPEMRRFPKKSIFFPVIAVADRHNVSGANRSRGWSESLHPLERFAPLTNGGWGDSLQVGSARLTYSMRRASRKIESCTKPVVETQRVSATATAHALGAWRRTASPPVTRERPEWRRLVGPACP